MPGELVRLIARFKSYPIKKVPLKINNEMAGGGR